MFSVNHFSLLIFQCYPGEGVYFLCDKASCKGVAVLRRYRTIFLPLYNAPCTHAFPTPTPLTRAVWSVAIIAQSIHPMSIASCLESRKQKQETDTICRCFSPWGLSVTESIQTMTPHDNAPTDTIFHLRPPKQPQSMICVRYSGLLLLILPPFFNMSN